MRKLLFGLIALGVFIVIIGSAFHCKDLRENMTAKNRSGTGDVANEHVGTSDTSVGGESKDMGADTRLGSEKPLEILVECRTIDLNGDCRPDQVRLYKVLCSDREKDSTFVDDSGTHNVKLEFEVDCKIYTQIWERSYRTTLSITKDRDGRPVCIVTIDKDEFTDGEVLVIPMVFNNGISALPLPGAEENGYLAMIVYADNYRALVEVPESGYRGWFNLPEDYADSLHHEDSNLRGGTQNICRARLIEFGDESYLEIVQYINGYATADDVIGYLESVLTWSGSEYILEAQRVLGVDRDYLPFETELAVRQAYINAELAEVNEPSVKDVVVTNYYGQYGNVQAVMIASSHYGVYTAIFYEEVDGIVFWYGNSNRIRVYDGVGFYTLQEAFEQELLTHDDLKVIAHLLEKDQPLSEINRETGIPLN